MLAGRLIRNSSSSKDDNREGEITISVCLDITEIQFSDVFSGVELELFLESEIFFVFIVMLGTDGILVETLPATFEVVLEVVL